MERQLEAARQRIKDLQEENAFMETKLESVTSYKDKLVGMIFKANAKPSPPRRGTGRKLGGQAGHRGRARKRPRHIDQEKDVSITHCPDCRQPLAPSHTTYERIVEDIPRPQVTVTLYHIQRQWCRSCQKEVYAVPRGTLPGFHFGLNLITVILMLKYRLRTPLAKIKEIL
jgi:transposase